MRIVFELPEALGNIRTEFLHIERKCVRHVYSTLHARNRLRIIITDQRASTLQYVTGKYLQVTRGITSSCSIHRDIQSIDDHPLALCVTYCPKYSIILI
jgi:hypothetical protein